MIEVDLRLGKHTMDFPKNEMQYLIETALASAGVQGKVVAFLQEKTKGSGHRKGIKVVNYQHRSIRFMVQAEDNSSCFFCNVIIPQPYKASEIFTKLQGEGTKTEKILPVKTEERERATATPPAAIPALGKIKPEKISAVAILADASTLALILITYAEHIKKKGATDISGSECVSILKEHKFVGANVSGQAIARIQAGLVKSGYLEIVGRVAMVRLYQLTKKAEQLIRQTGESENRITAVATAKMDDGELQRRKQIVLGLIDRLFALEQERKDLRKELENITGRIAGIEKEKEQIEKEVKELI